MKLEDSEWEMKWWANGTKISEHPIKEHLDTPGGDFVCDPKTGAFYINWQDEQGKDNLLVLFSAQTT